MLKIVLTSFIFIILAELAMHTFSLLVQLVFCTDALFRTRKIHYECGRVVMALDSGSDVRGFKPPHGRSFFSVPDTVLLITIFMIFSPS